MPPALDSSWAARAFLFAIFSIFCYNAVVLANRVIAGLALAGLEESPNTPADEAGRGQRLTAAEYKVDSSCS